jgi:predicted DNA-binding transcriptional regulator AlpA
MALPANRPLAEVPSLDAIAADPRCLFGLSRDTVSALLMRSAVVQSALAAAQFSAPDDNTHRENDGEDRLLDVKDAAVWLSLKVDYLYRHADEFPFTVRVAPGQLRFSTKEIKRYIKARLGRKA